jgi:hypothetical protein
MCYFFAQVLAKNGAVMTQVGRESHDTIAL